jgi:hypothetical protein
MDKKFSRDCRRSIVLSNVVGRSDIVTASGRAEATSLVGLNDVGGAPGD